MFADASGSMPRCVLYLGTAFVESDDTLPPDAANLWDVEIRGSEGSGLTLRYPFLQTREIFTTAHPGLL